MSTPKPLSAQEQEELLSTLRTRFQKNANRHKGVQWAEVQGKLEANADKLMALQEMERTGGEPDVVWVEKTGEVVFVDCSPESPKRRSLCYDDEALDARKEHKPQGSAVGMAAAMGVELLTEEEYRGLQNLEEFDLKTSSWLKTPEKIRKLGGSIFADRRYDTVFVYHNGAQSYYASRGFRGLLRI